VQSLPRFTMRACNPCAAVWAQSDGKLVHRMEMATNGQEAVAVCAANMRLLRQCGTLAAGVSHMPGSDPVVQLVRVLTSAAPFLHYPTWRDPESWNESTIVQRDMIWGWRGCSQEIESYVLCSAIMAAALAGGCAEP
jgi:hypothetical protein